MAMGSSYRPLNAANFTTVEKFFTALPVFKKSRAIGAGSRRHFRLGKGRSMNKNIHHKQNRTTIALRAISSACRLIPRRRR
jgi:hypothetical protein